MSGNKDSSPIVNILGVPSDSTIGEATPDQMKLAEKIAQKLTERLDAISNDLAMNWILQAIKDGSIQSVDEAKLKLAYVYLQKNLKELHNKEHAKKEEMQKKAVDKALEDAGIKKRFR